MAAEAKIAVIGIACRVPGADGPHEFWQALASAVDSITNVPSDRWDADELYDSNPGAPGKIVNRAGGFLNHIDLFDPELFGISVRDAQLMDPQNRLLLEVTLESLLHGCQQPSILVGSDTGVFVGTCSGSDYTKLTSLYGGAMGGVSEAASARVSHSFGLEGPSVRLSLLRFRANWRVLTYHFMRCRCPLIQASRHHWWRSILHVRVCRTPTAI
jgi:acyl transferase domain-containing protein